MARRPILIVAAVERELRPLKALVRGTTLDDATEWIATGAGKVASAIGVSRALALNPARCALQIGCAGAFPEAGLESGDVIIADEDVLADEGARSSDGFLDLEAIALPSLSTEDCTLFNRIPLPSPTTAEKNQLIAAAGGRFRLVSGRLVTVSAASGDPQSAADIAQRWHPLAETMEGAAASLAALASGCPTYQFRGISNQVGRRERQTWDIDGACANVATIAHRFLEIRLGQDG